MLVFWWSSVYRSSVAWSDRCCSHSAVYRLLKLIWKEWGCSADNDDVSTCGEKHSCYFTTSYIIKPLLCTMDRGIFTLPCVFRKQVIACRYGLGQSGPSVRLAKTRSNKRLWLDRGNGLCSSSIPALLPAPPSVKTLQSPPGDGDEQIQEHQEKPLKGASSSASNSDGISDGFHFHCNCDQDVLIY